MASSFALAGIGTPPDPLERSLIFAQAAVGATGARLAADGGRTPPGAVASWLAASYVQAAAAAAFYGHAPEERPPCVLVVGPRSLGEAFYDVLGAELLAEGAARPVMGRPHLEGPAFAAHWQRLVCMADCLVAAGEWPEGGTTAAEVAFAAAVGVPVLGRRR